MYSRAAVFSIKRQDLYSRGWGGGKQSLSMHMHGLFEMKFIKLKCINTCTSKFEVCLFSSHCIRIILYQQLHQGGSVLVSGVGHSDTCNSHVNCSGNSARIFVVYGTHCTY